MVLSMPGGVRIQEARPSYGRRGGRPPRRHSQSWVGAAVLDPVALQKAGGFRRTELNKIARLVNENREYLFDRITFDPNVMGGRACIRGLRVTVSLIVNLLPTGWVLTWDPGHRRSLSLCKSAARHRPSGNP